jgi:uncharacterized protein (DUF433 family)
LDGNSFAAFLRGALLTNHSYHVDLRSPLLVKFRTICQPRSVQLSVVSIDPEIMGGTPCFVGTRVPIRTLLDYVEAGDSIDEFLEDFPSVGHDKVIALLEDSTAMIIRETAYAGAA